MRPDGGKPIHRSYSATGNSKGLVKTMWTTEGEGVAHRTTTFYSSLYMAASYLLTYVFVHYFQYQKTTFLQNLRIFLRTPPKESLVYMAGK